MRNDIDIRLEQKFRICMRYRIKDENGNEVAYIILRSEDNGKKWIEVEMLDKDIEVMIK